MKPSVTEKGVGAAARMFWNTAEKDNSREAWMRCATLMHALRIAAESDAQLEADLADMWLKAHKKSLTVQS